VKRNAMNDTSPPTFKNNCVGCIFREYRASKINLQIYRGTKKLGFGVLRIYNS